MPFLAPILAFFTGPLGKIATYVGVALGGLGLAALLLHEHDARVLAEQALKEQAVISAEQLKDAQNATTQVQAVADATAARLSKLAGTKLEIANAPAPAASCGAPAALVHAVDALRTGSH